MKKSIFTIMGLLALFVLGCETELNTSINSQYYYKIYGTYYNDHIQSIYQLNDGSWLISGYNIDEADSTWAFICKSNPDGMVDWDTSFNDQMNTKAFDAIYSSSGENILVATASEVNTNTCYLSVIEMGMQGDITFRMDSLIHVLSICDLKIRQLQDGSIRLFSLVNMEAELSGKNSQFLLVHDYYRDNGIVKKVSYEIDEKTEGSIVVKNSNSNTAYVGFTFYEKASDSYTDIRLMAINGKYITWNKTFGSNNISETCSDMIMENQGITLSGNYEDAGSYGIYMLNTDLNGNQIASSTIQFDVYSESWGINSFVLNDSNNFVFTGYLNTGIDRSDIIFLETKHDGRIVRYNRFGSQGARQGNNIGFKVMFQENINGYILAGELEPVNNSDICIFSLDREGNWVPNE